MTAVVYGGCGGRLRQLCCMGLWRYVEMMAVMVVVVVGDLRWLCSVAVVVDGGSGCLVVVVAGGRGGDVW